MNTTINSDGCDSIATLDLVVNFPSESFSTVEIRIHTLEWRVRCIWGAYLCNN